jgi:hypothetical protein
MVTNARVYYTPRAAAGASAPGIPHALMGGQFLHNSGASRRGGAEPYLDVIGDITPDVIDCDRRSRNDRGNDRAGAFVPRRQRRYQGSQPWIDATC